MRYKFREDIATADVAFEAEGATLEELFEACALATTNVMVRKLEAIEKKVSKEIKILAKDEETLLFNFLGEIIFLKDAEQLLFRKYSLKIKKMLGQWELIAKMWGEKLDMKKHDLVVDVKAVTYHDYKVARTKSGWKAKVILDI